MCALCLLSPSSSRISTSIPVSSYSTPSTLQQHQVPKCLPERLPIQFLGSLSSPSVALRLHNNRKFPAFSPPTLLPAQYALPPSRHLSNRNTFLRASGLASSTWRQVATPSTCLSSSPLTPPQSSDINSNSSHTPPTAATSKSLPPSTLPRSQTLHSSTPQSKPSVLTPRIAKSALGTLVRYFKDLSRSEPFIARRLFAAVICIIISKCIGITVPFFFKRAIDNLMSHSSATATAATASASIRAATIAIILHGLARIAASLTHELRNAVFARAGQRIGRSITASSFAHLHSLELAFHTSSRTGALTRVIDRGTRSIMTIFRAMLFSFFPSFFELLLVCAVLFTRFSSFYVAITLATFTVFTAWTLAINDNMSRIRADMNAVENDASAKLTDALINVEAVKVFDNADHETARYDASLAGYEEIAIRNESLYARLNIGQTIAYTTGLTAILLLATSDIAAGRLTVGSVVLLSTMLQRLWIPLDFLGWQYREVKQSLIDMQNLFDILRRKSNIVDDPDAQDLAVGRGAIDFDNVTFVYPASNSSLPFTSKRQNENKTDDAKDESVMESGGATSGKKVARRRVALDGLSFSVPSGSSVALVGESGSGKSTATRLLCRLYDATGGRILIDGHDISKATLSSLRKAVSIVPQDTALFNDTIAYNIRYGRPSATNEEMIEAAKAASIHHVIMRTEHGYDTMVGERGVRLSGGERQRLSVARAFLKGSNIIIEDESTSALDTLTELEVSKALQKLGVNRTRIIVAHRLSTIMNVDHIVVMKGGRKVEEGSFDELVQKVDGKFRIMWERQQRKETPSENGMADNMSDNGLDGTELRDEEDLFSRVWQQPLEG